MASSTAASSIAAGDTTTGETLAPLRRAVDLPRAYRLLNHGPVVLVSSAHGGRRNVMAASWSMPVDFDPPKVAVVIDKSTLTRELVEASGAFALNIPLRPLARATEIVGTESGRDIDKFAALGIDTFAADKIAAPLVAGCAGWLECRVIEEPHNQQAYDLFLAEVVAASADPVLFSNGRWHFPAGSPRSLHYIAGGAFFETGEAFSVTDEAS
ncbi:MAG TPA: flavin reductase family protein [Dongiaceae bacterium]|nr:flavin reductase family protein [Dongiaceae bacterium]